MLSCGWPLPLTSDSPPLALYVALSLPPTWEAAILLTGATLAREFGSRAAISHPPHITLHPPFFPQVAQEDVIARLQEAASGLTAGLVRYGGVASFNDAAGDPAQIIMRIESTWCKQTHHMLLDRLTTLWDPDDTMTLRIWPAQHRRHGFTPHISLAIGDLPVEPTQRRVMKQRAATVLSQAMQIAVAPEDFVPTHLILIAYAHDWDRAPYTVVAGPCVLAAVPMSGDQTIHTQEVPWPNP